MPTPAPIPAIFTPTRTDYLQRLNEMWGQVSGLASGESGPKPRRVEIVPVLGQTLYTLPFVPLGTVTVHVGALLMPSAHYASTAGTATLSIYEDAASSLAMGLVWTVTATAL